MLVSRFDTMLTVANRVEGIGDRRSCHALNSGCLDAVECLSKITTMTPNYAFCIAKSFVCAI